jgi:hypothetical protein
LDLAPLAMGNGAFFVSDLEKRNLLLQQEAIDCARVTARTLDRLILAEAVCRAAAERRWSDVEAAVAAWQKSQPS